MRHLFIVNPAAKRVRGKVSEIKDQIDGFFAAYPEMRYDFYVSAWCRDAVTYIRQCIESAGREPVRVHAFGGTGTLFEVVNGVIGLPDVQVAAYPYGRTNVFLKYFKPFGFKPFASIHNQVFGKTVPIDAIRCGNNHGICFGIAGLEARSDAIGDVWIEKGMPVDLSFVAASLSLIMGKESISQTYSVEIDGQRVDGDYISIFIANTPCYGQNLYPGVDAHPDDGTLEIYMHGNIPRMSTLRPSLLYLKGDYEKIKTLLHFSGKRIKISSDKIMCLNIDSETFYGTSIEYEIVPKAIQFVCPGAVSLAALPRIYNKPERGLRGE